jgi:hypothetical protein
METAAEHSGFVWSITKLVVVSLGVSAPIVFGLLRFRGGLDLDSSQEIRFLRLLIVAAGAVAIGALAHGIHKVITDSQLELISSRIGISDAGKRWAHRITKGLIVFQGLAWLALLGSLIWALIILLTPTLDKRMVVGDSLKTEGAIITLGSTCILPVDSRQSQEERVFLVARLAVENVSSQAISVSDALDFELRASDSHALQQRLNGDTKRLGESTLEPHQKQRGDIVYEVPRDAHGLHLEYKPFGKERAYTWLIGGTDKTTCEVK